MPDRNKKERFMLAYSLRIQYIIAGTSLKQDQEVVGHTVSVVRKQQGPLEPSTLPVYCSVLWNGAAPF